MTDNAIITAAQNIAVAINNLAKATTAAYGSANSPTYTGLVTKQIASDGGRVNNITIITAASETVDVYDSKSTSLITSENKLASVDASNVGTFVINKNYVNGLVAVIGAGVDANVTYSPL